MMVFEKRDNMGYSIHPSLIVLIVMLSGGFALLMVYAIARFFYRSESDDTVWASRSPEQDAYMREVRERNMREIAPKGMRPNFDPHHLIPSYARNSQQSSSTAYV